MKLGTRRHTEPRPPSGFPTYCKSMDNPAAQKFVLRLSHDMSCLLFAVVPLRSSQKWREGKGGGRKDAVSLSSFFVIIRRPQLLQMAFLNHSIKILC